MPKKRGAVIRDKWPVISIVKKHGNTRYRVDGRPVEGRKFFETKAEAVACADELAGLREQGGNLALAMPAKLRQQANEAAEILEPWDRTLVQAAQHYAAFLKAEKARAAAVTVTKAIDQYLAAKRTERDRGELAPLTVTELDSKLRHVRTAFGTWKVSEITEQAAQQFLDSLPQEARGRANIRTKFSQLLNYCRRQGWLTANVLDLVRIRVPNNKEPDALSVSECEKLLRTAETQFQDLIPFLAIGLFAGLRPGELAGLSWQHVHLPTHQIEVLAATSKTRQKRYVPIDAPLGEWLVAHRRHRGLVLPPLFRERWKALRDAAKLLELGDGREWMDILRHTHASFWLAQNNNRAELAERLGNSADVIRNHYRRAIPKAEADAFWSIAPTQGRKVVAFTN
jgi:integrase